MTTFRIEDGDTLVLSVNGCAWQTVELKAGDFSDPAAVKPEELAKVLNRVDGVESSVEDGELELRSEAEGGHASLEIDTERSTAAARLGLRAAGAAARGDGPSAARLVGSAREPFRLPRGAEMTVVIDGKRRRVTFDSGFRENRASAEDVVKVIGKKLSGVPCVSREGQVMLVSKTAGPGSSVAVEAGRKGKKDAAAILGFATPAASHHPHRVKPARLRLKGPASPGRQVQNLTAAPIELHLPTGSVVLPARGTLAISPADLAHPPLRNLLAQGAVRVGEAPAV